MGEEGLTHCLAPTVLDENKLRITTLDHSEFPSDAVGDVFSGAWDESVLGFHHFDFLNACTASITIIGKYILVEEVDALDRFLRR